jgi:hypothetical protein
MTGIARAIPVTLSGIENIVSFDDRLARKINVGLLSQRSFTV